MTASSIDPAADVWLRRLVTELLEPRRQEELVRRAFEQISRDVPELTTPALSRGLDRALVAMSRSLLASLVGGVSAADLPDEAFDLVEDLVRNDLDLRVLLRMCRSGQHATVLALTEQVTMSALSEPISQQVMMHLVGHTTDWAGTAAEALSTAFQRERAVDPAEATARRREVVRAVLAGGQVDVAGAQARLGYRLEIPHVAMVLWTDDPAVGGLRDLRALADTAAARLGAAELPVIPCGEQTVWAWAGRPSGEPIRAGEVDPGGFGLALGGRDAGVAGFRRSHAEAIAAQRVARLGGDRGGVTVFGDIEIEHLISQNTAAMADFVRRELGALAGSDPTAVRLRETLRGYLRCLCSVESTARALDVHRNTVRYRVDRIEELLGHSVESRRLELELALRGVVLLAADTAG